MAQLVERSLPIPEVRGSNPVIGKNLYRTFTVSCIEKTKKKEAGNGPFLQKTFRFILRNEGSFDQLIILQLTAKGSFLSATLLTLEQRHSSVDLSAVPGSNPKHTIHAYSIYSHILCYICRCVEKRTKISKRPGFGPLKAPEQRGIMSILFSTNHDILLINFCFLKRSKFYVAKNYFENFTIWHPVAGFKTIIS